MSRQKAYTQQMKYRFENFGGIVAGENPPFLALVDREYMRQLGLGPSPLWNTKDQSIGLLSAPTEVHFAITNKCSLACPHCYMAAGEKEDGELTTQTLKKALDVLAEMNVFHVALGGGEALERTDLFEIAKYARSIGIVPNLTISGRGLTPKLAKKMKVFGQVNVSMDGTGKHYAVFRGKNLFDTADEALRLLTAAGVPTGINCVVGTKNFDHLGELFQYAAKIGLNEIEFLRFKPAGRASPFYQEHRTTYHQNIALIPMLADSSEKSGIAAKVDCSFVPMICYHKPPRQILESMATYGCEAGNVLLGVRSNGAVSGCSFLPASTLSVFDLPDAFYHHPAFQRSRTWSLRASEPCRSCDYLDICKGGCHAVSQYLTGNFDSPDPDCPFVVEYNRRSNPNA
jgi:radical SAM protein with 4Fe4S-binding SPASM domain